MSTLQIEIYRLVSIIFMAMGVVHLVLLYEIWRALKRKRPLDYLSMFQYFCLGLLSVFIYLIISKF